MDNIQVEDNKNEADRNAASVYTSPTFIIFKTILKSFYRPRKELNDGVLISLLGEAVNNSIKWIAITLTGGAIMYSIFRVATASPPVPNTIRTSNGGEYDPTDVGLQQAFDNVAGGGDIYLPSNIDIDRMFYFDQLNGINVYGGPTTLNFVNHTVWYDPQASVKGYRAVPPGTPNPAPRTTTTWGQKSMDFHKCKNILLKDITFTGASNIRFVIEQNANIHLNNVTFYNIDRWFTHHADYGSWVSTCGFESESGTTISGGVLVENSNITNSTNWGWDSFIRGNDATMENFTYTNCSARGCGMPVNGVDIIKGYTIDGVWVPENNNWQDWAVGFGITESYWSPTQLIPTCHNFAFTDCWSEYNRESGFHSEYRAIENNVTFMRCHSNWNGQKYYSQGFDKGYMPPGEAYCSGFLGFPDSRYNDFLTDCDAHDNFLYGYEGSNYNTQMSGCTASGNGIRDYY